jgi:hypothetical protein
MTYNLIELFAEIIKESIAPFLKKNGFKKQHLNFYKTENGLVFLFNFQKSTYNSADYVQFFINCGINSTNFDEFIEVEVPINPKEYECLYNQRFENITGFEQPYFELLESSDESKKRLTESVITELEKVITFYQNIKNIDDLVDLCIEKHTFFYEKIFKYLCLKNDMVRLSAYFQAFGDGYKDDERYLFMQHRLNTILQANGVAPMQFEAKMTVPLEVQRPIN